jgi:primosomal protein N' (replication factor Y)
MFATTELAARAELHYPPHGRLIAVRVDGPDADEHTVAELAQELTGIAMRAADGSPVEVIGPVAAPLARLRSRSRWQIWLRGTDRHALRRVARTVAAVPITNKNLRVALDVDPISTL